MGFDIGSAIMGGIEGFMLTGNPVGAGVMALEGGMSGQSGMSPMLSADSMISGDGDASSLTAYSQLAEAFG